MNQTMQMSESKLPETVKNPVDNQGQGGIIESREFNEDQPRNEKGEWTSTGGVSDGSGNLPATLKLDDIHIHRSVGAKAKNYDIMDLKTGEKFQLAEGTSLQNVEVFAGKGVKTPYRKASVFAAKYGGKESDWQHVKGRGVIDYYGESRKAEIHWSQCAGIGKVDFFFFCVGRMKVKYIGHDYLDTAFEKDKPYEVLSIEKGWYRIMIELDEDYLFPPELFEVVEE